MDRENDTFERPSRVQNMNYLFNEEEPVSADAPAPRERKSAEGRNSGSRRPSGQNPSGRSSSRSGQSGRSSSGRPRQAQPRQNRSASGQQPRRVRAEEIETAEARSPRQTTPQQARPRQVRPASGQGSSSSRSARNSASSRVNRSAGRSGRSGGSGRRGGRRRSSGFKKVILIYSAALLAILIIGLIIFGSFLGSLEKNQPARIAETVAQNLTADKASSYLSGHSKEINCFGDPKDLISQFVEKMQGIGQVSYIENKDYRADTPSYDITADGNTIAKLTLKKAGSGSFGLSKWDIDSLDIASYMDMASIEILAPLGVTVTLNGVELDGTYSDGTESIPPVLETASKYTTIPSYITYKVAGVPGTPEITAKDATGKDMQITTTDTTYVIGSATTQEFIDSVSGLVDHALDAWGKHFINMGGNLSAYILDGSEWYSYIFGGPDMDPIMTAFYEYESIANYTFTEKNISNYIRYTDNCFTVDVKYQMQIDFNNNTMSDNNQKLDATWVFITQDGGQNWYIVDCVYK